MQHTLHNTEVLTQSARTLTMWIPRWWCWWRPAPKHVGFCENFI